MCSSTSMMADNLITMDERTPSTNCNQSKELCSSGDENTPKVRKPYTITKQRERWTEEDHEKFLEALKLYGRAWRQIEEHVGTKTAVQIRSHAQKFFSKVVRDSSGSSQGSGKPIEIPPPRPKRKPKHPYPRKLGNTANKKLERSSSAIDPVSDQENCSPESVLTTVGSESASDILNHICSSLDLSATESNPAGFEFKEREIGCPSPSAPSASDALTSEGKFDTELDRVSPTTSFQLFGITVFVTDSHKPSSSAVGSTSQCHSQSPSTGNEEAEENEENVEQIPSLTQTEYVTQTDSCGGTCKGSWNPWSCGVPQLFYCLPSQLELTNSSQRAPAALPWWAFYDGLPFPEGSWSDPVDTAYRDLVLPKSTPENQTKGFMPYKRCLAQRELQQETEIGEDRECQRIRLCL